MLQLHICQAKVVYRKSVKRPWMVGEFEQVQYIQYNVVENEFRGLTTV